MSESGSIFDVIADISGGYSFRCAIEYLYTHKKQGNFFFFDDRIIYNSSNDTATVLNDLVYEASELQNYKFNAPPGSIVVAGVDITELRTIVRGIAKKDSVQLYMIRGKKELFVKVISSNSKSSGNIGQIGLIEIDAEILTPPAFKRGEDKPNKTVGSSDLNKMCTGLCSLKSEYVTISVFTNGVLFAGEGTSTRRCYPFGQTDYHLLPEVEQEIKQISRQMNSLSCVPVSPQENNNCGIVLDVTPLGLVRKFTVASKTIKSLGKLNNISANGNVRIYADEDIDKIKLICKVGTEGKLTILLGDLGKD